MTVQKPLPTVMANPVTPRQVLINLISNAMKFVAKGVAPRIVLRPEVHGERVRLWVEDNGIGIRENPAPASAWPSSAGPWNG